MVWVQWHDAKEHLHENLLVDHDVGYARWNMIQQLCHAHWEWVYDGSVDVKSCETWRSLVDCLAEHQEKEWDIEWEEHYNYPLDQVVDLF